MNPHRKETLLAAVGALAIGAAVGRLLLDSMNDADEPVRAALARHADPASTAPGGVAGSAGEGEAYNLVVVVLDGLGERVFAEARAGTALGAHDFRATVDVGTPSLSRPFYHVLLSGVAQAESGIRNNAHGGRARNDDLAARVRENGGSVGWALETVSWFHDLFGQPEDVCERAFIATGAGAAAAPFVGEPEAPSMDLAGAFGRVLATSPNLAVLHFTAIDHAGHDHGGASPRYRAAAVTASSQLGQLRNDIARTPAGARTVWMVGADHGHLDRGGHGGPEPEVRRTTWLGYWPVALKSRTEVPGVVAADRLAATFAAILRVAPPREALGEPLPLPDRLVASSAAAPARVAAVEAALLESTAAAHRGVVIRGIALGLGASALVATLLRRKRGRALVGAVLPAFLACVAFWLLGPGMTLSAIRTHLGFMAQSTGAMALGAALGLAIARRLGTPPSWAFAAAAAAPAGAYALTGGSMGRSFMPDSLLLVMPATGVVPWAVVAAAGVVASLTALFGGKWRSQRAAVPAAAQSAAADRAASRDS